MIGPSNALFNNAIYNHPYEWIEPPDGLEYEWGTADGGCGKRGDCQLMPKVVGSIFGDEHCSRKLVKDMQRASWAIVQPDESGNQQAWIRGTVPGDRPQSSPAAEYFAALYALDTSQCNASYFGDCLSVTRAFSREATEWGKGKSMYEGVLECAREWGFVDFRNAVKVKAHVAGVPGMPEASRWTAIGNNAADAHALVAKRLFSQIQEQAIHITDFCVGKALTVLSIAARIMPVWPRQRFDRKNKQEHGTPAQNNAFDATRKNDGARHSSAEGPKNRHVPLSTVDAVEAHQQHSLNSTWHNCRGMVTPAWAAGRLAPIKHTPEDVSSCVLRCLITFVLP